MSDEKEVSISTINQRLSSAFDAGNAVQFSIAAADAVVYAETLEQINERLHDRNKSQEARIKEIELELLSIREAGDDEVDAAIQACYDCFGEIGRTLRASPHLMKLEDLLKSLRQQLREAKRREQIMAHHCQKYVEITWEQAEAAYDAAEPVEISREEIDRIVGLVLAMNDEELEGKDLRQQLRDAQAEIERLKEENKTLRGYFLKGAFEKGTGYKIINEGELADVP